ncbi:MAG: mechanosensitive ion channel domain-containing protein [Maricaulaceae bacterium]
MLQSYLKVFLMSCALICGYITPAAAQTAESTQTENVTKTVDPDKVAADIEQSVEGENLSPAAPVQDQVPTLNLSDPALVEALDARDKANRAIEKADRAIAQAVREQRASVEAAPTNSDALTTSKKSYIQADPDKIKAVGKKILNTVLGWLTNPAFLTQVSAIVLIWWLLAPLLAKQLRARVFLLRDAPKEDDKFLLVRKYIFEAREMARPLLNIGLLAIAAVVLKSVFGQDWLVKLAQGLAVVFLIYSAIKQFAPNELTKKLGLWVGIPLALLVVFGYFDDLLSGLDAVALGGGENAFSALTLIKLTLFGSAFFWLGNFSNKKGQTAIRSQESLDSGVREIIAKFLQIAIFGVAAVMAMSAAGIGLGGLVVIISALSLGVGLGLQPIAANFVSGLIILFDRSVRIGDFVSLPDGQEGFVEAINMRSTTVETTDGKDIMVPNTTFTEDLYENWTHKDPRQRYEVHFSVAYDTDIDKLEKIIIPVFEAHPQVLSEPEEPDLELREFGESGIKFAVEFWCSGIDDGPNKFTSDLNFEVWRVLKKNKIQMPLPQREIRMLK